MGPQLPLFFFFPFSFFVAVCLLLCFYSFFPYFYPCIVSIFIHFMSPMFHIFFSLLCKQKYKVYNTEQKNYLFFPSKKKKKKNFPKKSYYDIKLLCNLYKIIYMCLPSYQK